MQTSAWSQVPSGCKTCEAMDLLLQWHSTMQFGRSVPIFKSKLAPCIIRAHKQSAKNYTIVIRTLWPRAFNSFPWRRSHNPARSPLERCPIYTSLLNVPSQKPAVSIKTCFKIIPRLYSWEGCFTGHINCLNAQVLWHMNSSWLVSSCRRFGETYFLTPSKCQ